MKKLLITLSLAFISCFAYSQQADSLFNAKDYVKAVPAYKAELQSNPKNLQALRRLAFCYTNIKDTEPLAISYFEKALKVDPNDMASNYYLGKIYKSYISNQQSGQKVDYAAKAKAHLKAAADAGSPEAIKELETLNN